MRSNRTTVRWRWKDLPLRGKGLVVVSIPLIPFLVMGWLVYSSQRQADEAELGARAHVVSRSPEALAGFREANAAIPGVPQQLGALIRDPQQIERLNKLAAMPAGGR